MSSADADPHAGSALAVLRERIRRDGPLGLDAYLAFCLADPEHGYWRTAGAIGAGGDFITAPEISQVFGEIIGLWAAATWQRLRQPAALRLIELGPGRGTLMRDALRAAGLMQPFLAAVSVHLIEINPLLRQLQQQLLSSSLRPPIAWHHGLADVPAGPAIVIGNEFLDALPIRQLVFGDDGAWRERTVGLNAAAGLEFGLGTVVAFQGYGRPQPGDVAEIRSGEDDLLAVLKQRQHPFIAAFIDYGPAELGYGDTLQAVQRHAYVDALREPGGVDITAHVQFAALADKARAAGFATHGPITQAEFFGRLGMAERAARLMAASPADAHHIETGVKRLLAPSGMGGQFKVLIVRSRELPSPEPFA
jgi:NADH dehydrogenase [ubiquinone] 1 alpha subcomplex assembly factor 7